MKSSSLSIKQPPREEKDFSIEARAKMAVKI